MSEQKPINIKSKDWTQTPSAVRALVTQSADRIERKNSFKLEPVDNYKVFRADLIDVLPLLVEKKIKAYKQFIFYPNPWPKKKLLQRRFHAHPIFLCFLELGGELELRSNWEIYIKEFEYALKFSYGIL